MPPPGEDSRTAEPTPDRFVAILRQGRREADADRPEAAERWFRDVLAAARGGPAERLACSCLVKLYVRQGRDLEALIMARRMVALSREAGSAEDRAFAWTGVATALVDLGDWDRFDAAAASLERAVGEYGGAHAAALLRHLHRTRAWAALARDDPPGAETQLSRSAEPSAGSPFTPEETRETYVLEAQIAAAARRFTRARTALTMARAVAAPLGSNALRLAYLEMRCALAIEGPPAALPPAQRLLDLLDGPDARCFGTAPRVEFARLAGLSLHRDCRAFGVALRAFDLAAEAVAARAAEVERCARDAAASDPEDLDLVAACRRRFDEDRRALRGDVERLFRDAAASGAATPPFAVLARDAIALCASCERARLPDGSVVPFGDVVPRAERLRVAHGTCDDCARRAVA